MAEGLLAHLLHHRSDVEVLSAGVAAYQGQPASSQAVEVMAELNIDISRHRSRFLTPELVRTADYILVMCYSHLDAVLLQYPSAAEKTYLVRQFQTDLKPNQREIEDPIGFPIAIYRRCRDQIHQALLAFKEVFEREHAPGLASIEKKPSDLRIFVGADEFYSEIDHFLSQTYEHVMHFVPHADDPLDYQQVLEDVAKEVLDDPYARGLILTSARYGSHFQPTSLQTFRSSGIASVFRKHPETGIFFIQTTADAESIFLEKSLRVICIPYDLPQPVVEQILTKWLNPNSSAFISPSSTELTEQNKPKEQKEAIMPITQQHTSSHSIPSLAEVDPEIFYIIEREHKRQQKNIELIASENFTSKAVMEAQGSCLTNKYAEGYPNARWYGGCEEVDEAEKLAIARAQKLFGAEHVNVQPHSGSQANMAVYFSVLKPGDKILALNLAHGGHLTHGREVNFSGRFFDAHFYGVSEKDEMIDYDVLAKQAHEIKPRMIVAGASAYSRIIDFEKMAEIAKNEGAYLFVDMAHIAGLVAAGLHPSPLPYADFVTTTTHKTLRGPRGGMILCLQKHAKAIDSQVFPGIQGGPLMHVIAAKAVCLGEALQPSFKEYQKQVIRNAKALCEAMKKKNYRIVSGGTDNHLMLVDLQPQGITGKDAQHALDEAGITVNKNSIPFDKQSPMKAGGIRLGTPAVTTRGMRENDMFDIAEWINQAIQQREHSEKLAALREEIYRFTSRFPLPY